jgi:glycosyltransferase involved in cell wall biosynthesis
MVNLILNHIIASSLECGGSERTVSNIINFLSIHHRSQLTLTTLFATKDFFTIPDTTNRHRLDIGVQGGNTRRPISSILLRLIALRRHLKRHRRDRFLVFGDQNALLVLIAGAGLNLRITVAERQNPYTADLPWYWRIVRLFAYHFIDALVVQTRTLAKDWAAPRWPWTKLVVIPNAVEIPQKPNFNDDRPNLVFVGRLNKLKGVTDLIRVVSRLRSSQEMKCLIIGDGPEKGNLQSMIQNLDLTERVEILGTLNNPWDVTKPGDIFVFPSYTEGFPNSLLEAMSHGLAPVSYDCSFGPSDLITNGYNGSLVPVGNEDELYARVQELILNDALRTKIASAAYTTSQKFSSQTILPLWLNTSLYQ